MRSQYGNLFWNDGESGGLSSFLAYLAVLREKSATALKGTGPVPVPYPV